MVTSFEAYNSRHRVDRGGGFGVVIVRGNIGISAGRWGSSSCGVQEDTTSCAFFPLFSNSGGERNKGVSKQEFTLLFLHLCSMAGKSVLDGLSNMSTLYAQHPTSTPTRHPGTTSFVAGDSKEHTTTEITETLPASTSARVTVHALSAGRFSLPEEQFVSPSSPGARNAVPSLCFLIQHASPVTGRTTRIVFDLGLRRDVRRYPEAIQQHLISREPYTTHPDVVKSLKAGGLTPDDIDYVIYSHVCDHGILQFCPVILTFGH